MDPHEQRALSRLWADVQSARPTPRTSRLRPRRLTRRYRPASAECLFCGHCSPVSGQWGRGSLIGARVPRCAGCEREAVLERLNTVCGYPAGTAAEWDGYPTDQLRDMLERMHTRRCPTCGEDRPDAEPDGPPDLPSLPILSTCDGCAAWLSEPDRTTRDDLYRDHY